MLKDSFVAYVHPEEGTVSDVLLMDEDFSVQTGIKATGVRNGLLVSNLSRSRHLTYCLYLYGSTRLDWQEAQRFLPVHSFVRKLSKTIFWKRLK